MGVTVLLILLFCHQTSSLDPSSILYQEVFAYHAETARKAEFANEVVNKIYNGFHQWFFTITFCEFTYFENRILKYVENYEDGYPILLLNGCPDSNKTRTKPRLDKHGQTAYLVTSNAVSVDESDYVIDTLKRTGVFKPRSAVIFIINEEIVIDNYFYYNIKNHFELLWSRSICNSVLIMWSERLRVFAYNPFFREVKDITEVEDISSFLSKQYYNLYGHGLRISVFRKVYVSDETGPILCDSRLTQTVIKFINATCEPLAPRDGNTVGDLLDTGATGVTADLIDGYTELELSSRILKNSYYGYIDTTYPITQDQLCFLVKNSDKQATFTTTMNLISNFLLVTFMLIVIIFIILGIIVRRIEITIWKDDKNRSSMETVMDLIKCFIRQTVDIEFWGPVFRFIIVMVILYSLIVNCVIDGVIITALSNPRYRPDINTMDKLVNSNLTVGVHNRDFRLFNKSLSAYQQEALKGRIEIFNDLKIKEVINKRQFQYATLIRKSDADYIRRKPDNLHNGRGLFHVVQDCPVPCFIVYGLRYGSPYLPRINFILEHLNQAGILDYWSKNEEFSLQSKISSEQKQRKPLDMDNIREVFYVLLIGMLISTISFVSEIVYYCKILIYLKLFLKTLVRRLQRLNFCR